jgi:hypothetical protein
MLRHPGPWGSSPSLSTGVSYAATRQNREDSREFEGCKVQGVNNYSIAGA